MAFYGLSEACILRVTDFHNKTYAAWRFSDVRLVNNCVNSLPVTFVLNTLLPGP